MLWSFRSKKSASPAPCPQALSSRPPSFLVSSPPRLPAWLIVAGAFRPGPCTFTGGGDKTTNKNCALLAANRYGSIAAHEWFGDGYMLIGFEKARGREDAETRPL